MFPMVFILMKRATVSAQKKSSQQTFLTPKFVRDTGEISNRPRARLILKFLARLLTELYSTRSNYYFLYAWDYCKRACVNLHWQCKYRARFFKKIQDWILKSGRTRKWTLHFFTWQIHPRSFGSWCVKGIEESTFRLDSSVWRTTIWKILDWSV